MLREEPGAATKPEEPSEQPLGAVDTGAPGHSRGSPGRGTRRPASGAGVAAGDRTDGWPPRAPQARREAGSGDGALPLGADRRRSHGAPREALAGAPHAAAAGRSTGLP